MFIKYSTNSLSRQTFCGAIRMYVIMRRCRKTYWLASIFDRACTLCISPDSSRTTCRDTCCRTRCTTVQSPRAIPSLILRANICQALSKNADTWSLPRVLVRNPKTSPLTFWRRDLCEGKTRAEIIAINNKSKSTKCWTHSSLFQKVDTYVSIYFCDLRQSYLTWLKLRYLVRLRDMIGPWWMS